MTTGVLPAGSRGFDINSPLDSGQARSFYAAGYRFAVRYVGRVQQKPHDASSLELTRILRAGLAVMLVQHVKSAEAWNPEGADLGRLYGRNAALFAIRCGYAHGATLWCDLEGVAKETLPHVTIAYLNSWYDAVHASGYTPGVYVGWRPGLTAHELYYRLRFRAYWAAYNLNRDQYPVVRGVQMRQFAATTSDRSPVSPLSAIDVNIAGKDALGDSPIMMLAPGDR